MGVTGRPKFPKKVQDRFWAEIRAGLVFDDAAAAAGVSKGAGHRWYVERGGVIPPPPGPASIRPRLSFEQREDIAVLKAQNLGDAEIARRVGVNRSTIGRELAAGTSRVGGKVGTYRASVAQAAADRRAVRVRVGRLAARPALAAEVTARLKDEHSPEQISGRLKIDFPDEEDMHVSHETIYKALFIQARGELDRDLHQRLRTGRAVRKTRRETGQRGSRIPNMVNISERPAEVEDRAVPGHWEGDLIVGSQSKSAIGTLVERMTGFVLLLHLPLDHGADAVAQAAIESMSRLPQILRQTLTWDQGSEMTNHAQIAAATDLDIYFCDPRSPWQRGTNENTNGLLRQYFAKGSDLSVYGPDYLDHVAAKLNNRPRKRLGFKTPAEALDELLSQPLDPHRVASTA